VGFENSKLPTYLVPNQPTNPTPTSPPPPAMTQQPAVQAVLLDIEGTVCPISFVRDVLFPYALAALPRFLARNWSSPAFSPCLALFPASARASPADLEAFVRQATAEDRKDVGLKALQGLLWTDGYVAGDIRAPIYADVLPAIARWKRDAKKVVIYSSGSVRAQKLLFAHTDAAEMDVTHLLDGYYDTTNAGMKQLAQSYAAIAGAESVPPGAWLFLSDNIKEVEAAKEAGMNAVVVVRPGNGPLGPDVGDRHTVVETFEAIEV